MKTPNRTLHFLAALLITMSTATVRADDTEIYVGFSDSNDGAQPNVLFILDTSGSMNADVTVTQEYNPATSYTGSCLTTRIYWKSSGVPSCGANSYFNKSQLRCDTATTPLDLDGLGVGSGFYQDRLGRWRNHNRANKRKWLKLNNNVNNPPHVECKADSGSHGENDGSAAKYIRNGSSGPWQSGASGSTNWNNTGGVYTLYNANYLNWYHNHATTVIGTRLGVVKSVTNQLVNSVSDINIGLMRFDSHLHSGFDGRDAQGGPVLYPVTDIDTTNTRTDFQAQVNALTSSGSTPLTETLHEAMLYYRGSNVYYGDFPNNTYTSAAASRDSGNSSKYKSPIEYECAKNFIVLLSDGQPTADDNSDSSVNSMTSGVSGLDLGSCDHGSDYTSGSNDDTCLDELAEYMYEVDNATTATGNNLAGDQNIITYTVGFGLNTYNEFLVSAAEQGGGSSYLTNDAQQLATAFTDIIAEILSVNTTFTAPAVSVNAFNRITNSKELYFAIFKPNDRPHWEGNIKRFELGKVNGEVKLLDASSPQQDAVDPNTGFFKTNATSYWTQSADAPDGDEASKGGLASRLYDLNAGQQVASSRKVYTYAGGLSAAEKNLTHADNKLHQDNAFTQHQGSNNPSGKITPTLLNMTVTDQTTEDDFLNVVTWASGIDVDDDDEDGLTTDGRDAMGAPLHSKPLLVTYSKTGPVTGTQKDVLFTITNDGYLHAAEVHESAGNTNNLELFSFVPPESLANLNLLYEDVAGSQTGSSTSIEYGLDGGIEVWIKDVDDDKEIEPADGDHVYLYFGQRRGGRSYYALDVTDLSQPKFLWRIVGGTTTGFDELSETWSKPERRRMRLLVSGSVVDKEVVVFAGGYDPDHDSADTARDPGGDTIGRAVYIVDAVSGDLLWSAGHTSLTPSPDLGLSSMKYSIPSEVRVVDVNGDGLAERMLVGDTGGQIFRFDVLSDGTIAGGRIADFQDTDGTAATNPGSTDNRRFYYPPDLALVKPATGEQFLSVAIGTGYRAHPLNKTAHERMYMLRDHNIYSPPTDQSGNIDYSTMEVSENDLMDITNQPNLDVGSLSASALAQYEAGWYLVFKNLSSGAFDGEKVVEKALTVQGKILFTTFTPVSQAGAQVGGCAPSQGTGKVYAVNVEDGTPVQNLDGVGGNTSLTATDRFSTLVRSGLPPEPTVIFPPYSNTDPVTLVGAEIADIDLTDTTVKTYWYQDNVH